MPVEVIADVVRSGFVEGHHYGSTVALDPDGEVIEARGDVRSPILPRSCNKPLQALGMLRAGLDLDGELLALACASHSGEPFHVEGVRKILAGAGLDESALQTPADYPLDDAARDAWIRAGGHKEPVLMNCSGKHAAMLSACVAAGWPTSGYLDPDHPLQRAIEARLAQVAGEEVPVVVVDGCGAPQHALSLTGLARGIRSLVEGPDGSIERSVADAMRAAPWFVAGTDREDTELMKAVPGLLVKGGAEGVHVAALPGRGAVALKLDDGADRGRMPALSAGLRRLGVPADQLTPWLLAPVLGGGAVVGEVRPASDLAV